LRVVQGKSSQFDHADAPAGRQAAEDAAGVDGFDTQSSAEPFGSGGFSDSGQSGDRDQHKTAGRVII